MSTYIAKVYQIEFVEQNGREILSTNLAPDNDRPYTEVYMELVQVGDVVCYPDNMRHWVAGQGYTWINEGRFPMPRLFA